MEEGPIKGPEAFKPFYRAFRSAIPDIKIVVRQCITEGNMCAVRCDVSGTHQGNGLGVAATGRPIFFTGIAILRVEHGMIRGLELFRFSVAAPADWSGAEVAGLIG